MKRRMLATAWYDCIYHNSLFILQRYPIMAHTLFQITGIPSKIRFGIILLRTQRTPKILLLPFNHIPYMIYMRIIYIIGISVHE